MKKMDFHDLLNQYIKEKSLSSASIKTYTGVVNRFVIDTKIIALQDIDFEALLEWRLSVRERSSDITWNNYLRHMRALWKFAIHKKYIHDFNPFKDLNWGKYKKSKKKTLTQQQLKRILLLLSDEKGPFQPSWFWETIFRFMYYTGLRRKQVITLTWKDVDLTKRLVYLSAQGEKTDIERQLPLQANLTVSLFEYRKKIMDSYSRALKPDGQLFNVTILNSRFKDGTMTEEQLSGFFRRLSQKVNFPVSPHMLRHTMATEIAKTGQIKELQLILGHSDVRTTLDFYVHPDLDALNELINGLGEI